MRIKIHSQDAVPLKLRKSSIPQELNVDKFANSPTHGKSGNNYFTLFQHVIARNSKIKQLLKEYSRHSREVRQNSNLITTRHFQPLQEKQLSFVSSQNEGKFQERQHSQRTNRYNMQRFKWKESMMRRTNNGTYGRIIKGSPKNKYSYLLNISHRGPNNEENQRETHSLTNSKFLPMGKLSCEKERLAQSCHKKETQKESKYEQSPFLSNIQLRIRKKIKISTKNSQQQYMPNRCISLIQQYPINNILTSYKRYQHSRTLTPKPWEQTIN